MRPKRITTKKNMYQVGIAATSLLDAVCQRQLLLRLSVRVPEMIHNAKECATSESTIVAFRTGTNRAAPPGDATQRLFRRQDLIQFSVYTAFG